MPLPDELPRPARTAFRNAVGRARDGDLTTRAAFDALGVLDVDRTHTSELAERVAVAIRALPPEGAASARGILFGRHA